MHDQSKQTMQSRALFQAYLLEDRALEIHSALPTQPYLKRYYRLLYRQHERPQQLQDVAFDQKSREHLSQRQLGRRDLVCLLKRRMQLPLTLRNNC